MKRKMLIGLAGLMGLVMVCSAEMQLPLRDLKNGGTIYQINLRMFTPEGTLARAEELLPHIANLGVAAVYLCPVVEADGGTDRAWWSPRQKASGANNPRNPYRQSDYYKIDPEYGTTDDLKSFVQTAHKLGLRVLLDLVYLHCGPNATLCSLNPDYLVRDEKGGIKKGEWLWPLLNFKSPQLREYLWKNMEHFIRTYDVDGYRCDVGDQVPLDFWEEGARRIRLLKPDAFMLNEGNGSPEHVKSAFDAVYGFSYFYALQALLCYENKEGQDGRASVMRFVLDKYRKSVGLGKCIRGWTNHDAATDKPALNNVADARIEAALALSFAVDGYPFIYNGQEIADHNRHQMFYCAGNRYGIDWSRALTDAGTRRMRVLRALTAQRARQRELFDGGFEYLETPEDVLAFVRGGKTLCVISFSDKDFVLTYGGKEMIFKPHSWQIGDLKSWEIH